MGLSDFRGPVLHPAECRHALACEGAFRDLSALVNLFVASNRVLGTPIVRPSTLSAVATTR